MKSLYKKGPTNIPENLTKPTKSFTKHVWLSIFGLVLFITIYLVLTLWFGKLAYNLFRGNGGFFPKLLGGCFAFLSLFMAKSLFIFSKKEENPLRRYLTKEEEPVLFDYLYKLADEADAPRPHKVFLSDRVNASVSYDLSILNLLLPSKKNLEIGLGLINVLSLGEFKAVIAHEFGHFAQRSMLLGRYVYIGQQIARKIVNKRDAFDKLLAEISRFDLRVAWIGWILSILVWAIRALIETCFKIVAVAEKALSREMEFQADLVAVSLTGSDALINALYKLQIADEAYSNALEVVNSELAHKNAINNVYTLQTNYITKMAWILNKPEYGKSPIVPKENPEKNRIFTSRAYNPPQMWATHPVDKDREENAKKIYIAAEIDTSSSWNLLSKPKEYQLDMTDRLIKTVNIETTLLTEEESVKKQNEAHFNWAFLNPKYNLAFLNRLPFVNYKTVDEIFELDIKKDNIKDAFTTVYAEDLSKKLDQLKELNEEIEALTTAKYEVITAEKRILWHRGEQLKRSDIDTILKKLQKEKEILTNAVTLHDKKCRNIHYEAAKTLHNGSANYHKKLVTLVHYTEHTISDVHDCAGKFNNVLAVALADGRVSNDELVEILSISDDYYYTIKRIYDDSKKIKLDENLTSKLKLQSYEERFETFRLPPPDKNNINNWVNVIQSWANSALINLDLLRKVSLEKLLELEEQIEKQFNGDSKVTENYYNDKISIVEDYKLLVPGTERKIVRKLSLWNRFFIGDGLFPTIAKAGVSGGMIAGALLLGIISQKSNLYIYNGLATNINVRINNQKHQLHANSKLVLPINYGNTYHIISKTKTGEIIEELQTKFDDPAKEYIYNVANSGAFIKHYVYYGYNGSSNLEYLGAKKWFGSNADYKFIKPPSSISGSNKTLKSVLTPYSNIAPRDLLSIVKNKDEYRKLIHAHVLWDDIKSNYIYDWVEVLEDSVTGINILKQRLKKDKNSVVILRGLLHRVDSLQRQKMCVNLKQKAANQPQNGNYYYLSSKCIKDNKEKNKAYINGYKKWKDNPWLSYAAAYSLAEENKWEKSYNAFVNAFSKSKYLSDRIKLDAERVRRVTNAKTKLTSEGIKSYKELESGKVSKEDVTYAYYLKSQGKLNEAYTFISKFNDSRPYFIRLLAASDGANEEIINAANKLETEDGVNYNSIWATLGLAIRQKKDTKIYMDLLEKYGLKNKIMQQFLKQIKNSDFNAADKIIEQYHFITKAHFYILANTILRNKIPKKWKHQINTILFISEKPYIK